MSDDTDVLVHAAWFRGELDWLLHETQLKIDRAVNSTERSEVCVFSSRQLGKSYWASVYAVRYCLRNPNSIVRIMAPTLKQVSDIVNDNIIPITRSAPPGLIKRRKSEYRWDIGDGSQLRLGSLERSNVEMNRGGNAKLIILEEGGSVASDDYEYAIRSVVGPQLLRSGGKLVHVTTPSIDPLHFIHRDIVPKCRLSQTLFTYTVFDNPQLTEEQIEKAKELCGGDHTTAWKREYLAQIVRDEQTSICPHVGRSHFIKVQRPQHVVPIVAGDWGGVRDNTVMLLMGYDFERDKVQVYRERWWKSSTPTNIIVDGCLEMEREVFGAEVTTRWVDVPGQIQIDLNKFFNFAVMIPQKTDWTAAVNSTQLLFSRNQIEIDESCEFLRTTLESGQFNSRRTDFDRTDSLGHCDAFAALMYGQRMLSRQNPWPNVGVRRDYVFERPKNQAENAAILPKLLGSFKKWGK